jgi:hypothetical protein
MQPKRKRSKQRAKRRAAADGPSAPAKGRVPEQGRTPRRPSTTSTRHVTRSQQKMLAAIARGVSTFRELAPILLARNTVVLPGVQNRKHLAMLAGLITRGYVKELGGGRYELTPKGTEVLER